MQTLERRITELEMQARQHSYTQPVIVVVKPGESTAQARRRVGLDEDARTVMIIPGKLPAPTHEGVPHDSN